MRTPVTMCCHIHCQLRLMITQKTTVCSVCRHPFRNVTTRYQLRCNGEVVANSAFVILSYLMSLGLYLLYAFLTPTWFFMIEGSMFLGAATFMALRMAHSDSLWRPVYTILE